MDARSEKLKAVCIVLNRDEQAKFETSTVVSEDHKCWSVDVFIRQPERSDLTDIRS